MEWAWAWWCLLCQPLGAIFAPALAAAARAPGTRACQHSPRSVQALEGKHEAQGRIDWPGAGSACGSN